MDELPPHLKAAPGVGGTPGARRRRAGRALPFAVAFGVLAGLGVVAVVGLSLGIGRSGADEPERAPQAAPVAPPEPVLKIIFPEGFTRKEMAERIRAVNGIAIDTRGIAPSLDLKAYLKATRRSKLPAEFAGDKKRRSLEGFLFPATYEFTRRTTSKELVELQIEAFRKAWGAVGLKFAKSKKLTPYDVLIIASMIEGEVQVPKERALVAAVIYNRLKAGLPLGIDATLRYGLDIPPTRAIRQSELEHKTPYNTRIHQGLPPTPIGNPGLAAMQAAAHPAKVKFLYFVRKKDCRSHFFTAGEKEFLARLAKPRC